MRRHVEEVSLIVRAVGPVIMGAATHVPATEAAAAAAYYVA
jgi:hypothetical protein